MKLNEVAQDNYIHAEMKNLNISTDNYTINNGMVDVEGDIRIPRHYTSIPVSFRSVSGYFNCTEVYALSSLKGAPREVGGGFWCVHSGIDSLEGAPREVGGSFTCSHTNITSLEGASLHVSGDFLCSYTKITSLEGAPREVGNHFICRGIFKQIPDHSHIIIGGEFIWREDMDVYDENNL